MVLGTLNVGAALLAFAPAGGLDPVGLAAALLCPLTIALGTVLTQRWGRPTSLVVCTGWQLIVSGLFLVPLMLGFEGSGATLTGSNALAFAYLAFVGTGLAYWL